jgi:hypothetical protein
METFEDAKNDPTPAAMDCCTPPKTEPTSAVRKLRQNSKSRTRLDPETQVST